jgi:hypothetical protein
MMGRLKHDQGQFFYSFRLDEAVPGDHPVRQIASVVDLSWVHSELARASRCLARVRMFLVTTRPFWLNVIVSLRVCGWPECRRDKLHSHPSLRATS